MAEQPSTSELARRWLQQDRDDNTRSEIENLLQANDIAELDRRLRRRIAFGTAGLRSSMKAGFAHMNSLTVLQASQGLASYILQRQTPSKDGRLSVVVGYDARYNSEKFARLAAGAFIAKGLRVLWFGQLVHTPMVPFAVSHFKAAAGVMVTASHNPKADNGYKVYWKNGCQIIPPHDSGIAQAIDEVHSIDSWDEQTVDSSPLVRRIYSETLEEYFQAIQRLITPAKLEDLPCPKFTYTPMHGVGLPYMREAARVYGVTSSMSVVNAQSQPDPEFTTVPFPNPEEQGALNLAFEDSAKNDCKFVLANDPDADRFAAAECLEDGPWHQFTGNQIGILLASYIFIAFPDERDRLVMLASTVSSRMLAAMAHKERFGFKETLTGFKWLGNVGQQMENEGRLVPFAFEEAIGYMFPTVVWDKDGITTATVFLAALRKWHNEGTTPWQKLQNLYERYGYFEDSNTYLISPSADITEKAFAKVRQAQDGKSPSHVGKRKILRWRDLTVGYDTKRLDGKPDLPIDPNAQMITCELEDNVTFTARGSGTEPKIKLYIEAAGKSSLAAKSAASEVLKDLVREWFPALKLAGE